MIETDPHLKKILASLSHRPELDYARLTRELLRLAETIPTVRFDARMEDARTQLSSQRSRACYVAMLVAVEIGEIRGVHKRLRDHLIARYHNHLGLAKNEAGRNALVNKALAPLVRRLDKLQALSDVCGIVLGDYDSRGFAFRDTVAARSIREREL